MLTTESIYNAIQLFLFLFAELFFLFIGISFIVALLQIYISKDTIQTTLTTKRPVLNSFLGALFGSVTPFCSCSTIPVLTGLIKSGAPFSGVVSFLLTSPILNPAIIALFLTFFGVKASILYAGFTFFFAVAAGTLLEKFGFAKEIKELPSSSCGCCGDGNAERVYSNFKGTFWQRNMQAFKIASREAWDLFRSVLGFLLLGAGIGAFIYEFIPQDLLVQFAGQSNWIAVPIAAVLGIPLYIRTETMIPIASILIDKGVGYGTMVALIIGGAGASIPELSLLSSIFKRKMMAAFLCSVLFVAISAGFIFNLIME